MSVQKHGAGAGAACVDEVRGRSTHGISTWRVWMNDLTFDVVRRVYGGFDKS